MSEVFTPVSAYPVHTLVWALYASIAFSVGVVTAVWASITTRGGTSIHSNPRVVAVEVSMVLSVACVLIEYGTRFGLVPDPFQGAMAGDYIPSGELVCGVPYYFVSYMAISGLVGWSFSFCVSLCDARFNTPADDPVGRRELLSMAWFSLAVVSVSLYFVARVWWWPGGAGTG